MTIDYLDTTYGKLAYKTIEKGSDVGVIFLGGLASSMQGTKATYLEDLCDGYNISFTKFDYFGHGKSPGDFRNGNITIWKRNIEDILNKVASTKRQILIGSSMSGWMMCHIAAKYPERIAALIGIAAAPDFTKDIYSSLGASAIEMLNGHGYITFDRYGEQLAITKILLDDGNSHLILGSRINVNCPVVLLHGMADEIVNFKKSIELANCLNAKDVEVRLLKHADHNMKDEKSLAILSDAVLELVDSFEN